MSSKKKKPWIAWILGGAVCLLVPGALVGKSVWNDFRATVGRNKAFIETAMKDHYQGKSIDCSMMTDTAKAQVYTVFRETTDKMGKFVSLGSTDTVPNVADAMSKGWELSYNLPIQFEKGYRTFTIRVRNDGVDQKIVSLLSYEGILPHDDVKSRIKQQMP